jgi:hypothetical protein
LKEQIAFLEETESQENYDDDLEELRDQLHDKE